MVEALLIIDMQLALVPALWQGEEVADRIALLAERAGTEVLPWSLSNRQDQQGHPLTLPTPAGS